MKVKDPAPTIALARRCSISDRRDRSASAEEGYGLSMTSFSVIAGFEIIQLTNSAAASLFCLLALTMIVSSAKTDMTGFLPSIGGIGKKSIGTRQHFSFSPRKRPRLNDP